MKSITNKIFSIALELAMILALAACTGSPSQSEADSPSEKSVTTSEQTVPSDGSIDLDDSLQSEKDMPNQTTESTGGFDVSLFSGKNELPRSRDCGVSAQPVALLVEQRQLL